MTHRTIFTIDGGSASYWADRKEGFRLIRAAEQAAIRLERAPTYIAGEWDDDYGGYTPVENIQPFEDMADAIQALEANQTAISILVAQGRDRIGSHAISAVIREMELVEGHIEDPASNPLWGPDTD